ncbi:DNA replication initiation factor CDC45 [Lachancea thermotolerans CBS 6340]|uniref:KLTH0G12980p n=1 Tax=Lachancea thermotolerans (strain ATCC 56472 / CBS 6340 / NRRL Y-8284) TaxID=559295 RepID=C5DMZ7_LACTC|nr:KLTH0G12980p [Lachancea thermotolerans CBS 6340]CAR25158.1 KLTH0G12980p [Lachancea thermotolerans CBS 6340]
MYLKITQFQEAYERILKFSSSHSSCQLVIFVSCLNIDALCASKMLSKLFKKQLIQLQLVPVFGYSELRSHFQKLDENVSSVIFVGCGGMIDIEAFLEINEQDYWEETSSGQKLKRNIYVLDTHRPWNLHNLFGSQIVTCFDDGTVEETLQSQKEAYIKLVELEEQGANDEEEVSSDEDAEEDQDGDTEEDDEQDSDGNGGETAKRRNTQHNARSQRKLRKKLANQYEEILEEYYAQGTSVSNSISVQVYSLLSSQGETSIPYLWLTVLGATSLDTSYPQIYNRLQPILQDEVRRLSPNESYKTPDTISLEIQPDYYLFLLRHSSLYDSFFYSNYVNAKLSLWNENGKKRLHKIFARMGIPLSTAQENWLYMDNRIKKELGSIFDKNLERYGLQDIVRDGFVRTFGYRGAVSASEFVEAITALLEVGQVTNPDEITNRGNANADNDSDQNMRDVLTRRERKWVSNFWLSWDALDDNIDLMRRGIKHAQHLQRCVFNTGVAILEKKMIKNLRLYRLCALQDGPDLDLYRNPLTLLRLGNWIIECCAEAEDRQLLPLVLASLDVTTETYLVAGMAPRYPRGMDKLEAYKPILNNFHAAFQYIAAETGAKVRIDNFESSIIEIKKEDLSPFLEKLTLSGLL